MFKHGRIALACVSVDDGKTANSEETGAAGHVSNAADVNQLSVSLVVDSPPKYSMIFATYVTLSLSLLPPPPPPPLSLSFFPLSLKEEGMDHCMF